MPKILLIEDDELIRLLYSEELNEAGYDVITAKGGYNVIERIEEEKPNLVILNMNAADSSSLDIFHGIRNNFCGLPVILSTVYDRFKYAIRPIAADFFVVKSYDLTELKKKVDMAFEAGLPRWQPHSEAALPDLSNEHNRLGL